jgi:hypothetical protein
MKSAYAADEVKDFIEKNIAQARPVASSDVEARRARAEANRHDAELARKELSAAGLDLERLDTLARERAQARRSRADDERRRAIEGSTAVDRWLTGRTPTLPIDPLSTNVIVDRVTFIRTFADSGVVVDSNIGSLDSWARYKLQPSSGAVTATGLGRLSFFVLWQNPRNQSVVANVGPRVVVNAHLSVDAEWNGVAAWFIGGSEARATVRARTTVWAMWDSSVQAIVSDVILGSAGASGGFFGGYDSTSIAVNQFVPGSGFFVPKNAYVLIEVSLLTEYQLTSGSVDFDAASGAFKVSVPHLIVTVT